MMLEGKKGSDWKEMRKEISFLLEVGGQMRKGDGEVI